MNYHFIWKRSSLKSCFHKLPTDQSGISFSEKGSISRYFGRVSVLSFLRQKLSMYLRTFPQLWMTYYHFRDPQVKLNLVLGSSWERKLMNLKKLPWKAKHTNVVFFCVPCPKTWSWSAASLGTIWPEFLRTHTVSLKLQCQEHEFPSDSLWPWSVLRLEKEVSLRGWPSQMGEWAGE